MPNARFYAMRKGTVARVVLLPLSLANQAHQDGWELGPRPFDTRGEAEAFVRETWGITIPAEAMKQSTRKN